MPGGRGRGGARSGTPGKLYPNRSDLSGGGKVPIAAPTGGQYGSAKASLDAQRAVPVASPPVGGLPGPIPDHIPQPGQLGDLFADSTDPSEHVMNGSSLGPGAGPEAFGLAPGQSTEMDVNKIIGWLPALEHIANGPNSSDLTRQMVRAIKMNANLTPGVQQ